MTSDFLSGEADIQALVTPIKYVVFAEDGELVFDTNRFGFAESVQLEEVIQLSIILKAFQRTRMAHASEKVNSDRY